MGGTTQPERERLQAIAEEVVLDAPFDRPYPWAYTWETWADAEGEGAPVSGEWFTPYVRLEVAVGAAALTTIWFAPGLQRARLRTGPHALAQLQRHVVAVVASVVAVVALVGGFGPERALPLGLLLAWAAAAAPVRDLVTEVRFLGAHDAVSVHPSDHVPDARQVAARLAHAGLPVTVRGLATRTLLQSGGGFLPLEVLVPPDRAEQARELLAIASDGTSVAEGEAPTEVWAPPAVR